MSELIKNLYILFDAAWEENNNNRGTDITRMVTTLIPDAIQDLQAYEDLGFTPQDIAYMAKFYKENTSAEAITANMKIAAMLLELEKLKARYAEK